MSEISMVEIELETLLKALEGEYNPNCYDQTGAIRQKFRKAHRSTVIIPYPSKGAIKVTKTDVDIL